MAQLLAYHGSEELRSRFLAELRKHREQDQFVRGTYCSPYASCFRGCAVGCSIDSMYAIDGQIRRFNDHASYPSMLGWPEWLAHMEDFLFETLPLEQAYDFPIQLSEVIPAGVDLQAVMSPLIVELLSRAKKYSSGIASADIASVADLWLRVRNGFEVPGEIFTIALKRVARAMRGGGGGAGCIVAINACFERPAVSDIARALCEASGKYKETCVDIRDTLFSLIRDLNPVAV